MVVGRVDPLIKYGLRHVLAVHEGFRLLDTSTDGAGVERLIAQQGTQVAIFDETVEHQLLARLKVRHPSVGLLVLTASPPALIGTTLVALGASCLARDAADTDIRAAVHLAAEGKPIFLSAARDSSAQQGPTVAELLSPRELEVFDLISQGRSYIEVGQELRIAPETVKSHTVNICRKLGVRNKQQLGRMSLDTTLQAPA